tara:strand:+ start:48 stop:434 length:387 start_codon:yes stop_codon:yes gene_type:complete
MIISIKIFLKNNYLKINKYNQGCNNMSDENKCCICLEVKNFSHKDFKTFNGLSCKRNHLVCFVCVKKLLLECREGEDCNCIGYFWKCPCCRMGAGLVKASQLLGVMSGSWKSVYTINKRTDECEECED